MLDNHSTIWTKRKYGLIMKINMPTVVFITYQVSKDVASIPRFYFHVTRHNQSMMPNHQSQKKDITILKQAKVMKHNHTLLVECMTATSRIIHSIEVL